MQTAAATDPYAKTVADWSTTAMQAFPELKKEDVDAILDWVDAQPDPVTMVASTAVAAGGGEVVTEEDSNSWVWILLGIIFVTVIMAVSGVRRQLKHVTAEVDGEEVNEGLTYSDEFRTWAWKNRKYVGLGSLILFISLCVSGILSLSTIGVVENYQPSQPIAFPHAIHTGTNGIDCKYCHNSVTKSKSAGLPTVNVCMNCHKKINGEGKEYQGEINKIYAAAGWDPTKGPSGEYTNETSPIVWNKVHNLPDHVYFNHSQHVVVGGLDCKQCHGDMAKLKETAKVQPREALNKIQENIDSKIEFDRATMTMGWCIQCNEQSGVSIADGKNNYYTEIHDRLKKNDYDLLNEYNEDGRVYVKELGGWECSKCHY